METNLNLQPSVPHKSKFSILWSILRAIFSTLLWIQGVILVLLLSGWFTIFFGSHLFTLFTIGFLLLLTCSCIINFHLIFHFRRQYWIRSVVSLALIWGLPFLGSALLNTATARVVVEGHSMENSISNGGFYLVDKQAYQHRDPQRGDIVIYYLLDDPNTYYINRIVGLPGEQIDVRDGTVYVNTVPLLEDYVSTLADYTGQWKVGDDQYFVLGDNRSDSSDSHSWGSLPRKNIFGKVVGAYWPPEIFGNSFLSYSAK